MTNVAISAGRLNNNPSAGIGSGLVHSLHYGNSRTPLSHVAPDARHAGMFRIAWPDGGLSDMVNLSRAKDAAAAIAERGPPARNRRLFHWKIEPSKCGGEASLVRGNGRAAP